MDASAISLGVIGRYGVIDGVWIEPVTAQVMMTLRGAAMGTSSLCVMPEKTGIQILQIGSRVAPKTACPGRPSCGYDGHLIACGLIGEPTAPVIGSGGPQK